MCPMPRKPPSLQIAALKPESAESRARRIINRCVETRGHRQSIGAGTRARPQKDNLGVYDKRLWILTHSSRSEWDLADRLQAEKGRGAGFRGYFKRITPRQSCRKARPSAVEWARSSTLNRPTSTLVNTHSWENFEATVRGYFPKTDAGHPVTLTWTSDGATFQECHRCDKASIDSGDRPPLTLADVTFANGGPCWLKLHLNDGNDHLQVDNDFYRVIDVASAIPLLVVEGTGAQDVTSFGPAQFLMTATDPEGAADPKKEKVKAGPRPNHFEPEKITPSEMGLGALAEVCRRRTGRRGGRFRLRKSDSLSQIRP